MTFADLDDYYWTMAVRHRLVTVFGGGSVAALCTFFVLPDTGAITIQRYYDRQCWSLPSDTDDGAVIFVDKLFSYIPWTKTLTQMVEDAITQQVPSWQVAVWYRPGHGGLPDRRYTYHREGRNGADILG